MPTIAIELLIVKLILCPNNFQYGTPIAYIIYFCIPATHTPHYIIFLYYCHFKWPQIKRL